MGKFTLAQRIRTGTALAIVFLLVLATNQIDSTHFSIVQKSLTSVYKDRLVAKDYIYKISRQLQLKKSMVSSNSSPFSPELNEDANDSINYLVALFSMTQLTTEEESHFKSFQNHLKTLYQLENRQVRDEPLNNELPSIDLLEDTYTRLFEDLDKLSQIQLEEGKKEIENSTRAIDSSNFIAGLEIIALIIIGLLIQLLIFYRPKSYRE